MRFRPCIDIHNGKVKQIVGGSLRDQGDRAKENFVSEKDAGYYADFYKKAGLDGGHIIMLNHAGSEYYEQTKEQALCALRAYPGGLQAGGGITAESAPAYIGAGAQAVIVTSYVFRDGRICSGFAFGGPEAQRALLEGEGIVFGEDGAIDMKKFRWEGA